MALKDEQKCVRLASLWKNIASHGTNMTETMTHDLFEFPRNLQEDLLKGP